jgi:hypothetical protein
MTDVKEFISALEEIKKKHGNLETQVQTICPGERLIECIIGDVGLVKCEVLYHRDKIYGELHGTTLATFLDVTLEEKDLGRRKDWKIVPGIRLVAGKLNCLSDLVAAIQGFKGEKVVIEGITSGGCAIMKPVLRVGKYLLLDGDWSTVGTK